MRDIYEKFDGDDLDFYEMYLMKEPLEKQIMFIKEHPQFLKAYPVNPIQDGRFRLLMDKTYRGIMRKIKFQDC